MSKEIGWRFPPTNGGLGAGFNDSGIAHFNGAPLASLARETIQNSLDARLEASSEPVHVSFELIGIKPELIGRCELSRAIDSSLKIAVDDPMASGALKTAAKSIKQDKIHCLRISDRNTTGLSGDHWRALVKMQGVSHKPEIEGAGGSHGIGKYAPFAVSTLRTVFYWTCFREGGEERERFQGKSVLMSHNNTDGEETQGTGFYGVKQKCQELSLPCEIPNPFRVLTLDERPIQGTSLAIMGFRETHDWRPRIAASVIGNFFFAIARGQLTVTVEPVVDESVEFPEFEIDCHSIDKWFQYLTETAAFDASEDAVENTLQEARTFWDLSNGETTAEKQDVDLGHCRLWIRTAEGLSSKVAFVRRTGMLVTAQQRGLIRFPGFRDFAALCVFEDPAGNELLRRMENPKHDQFEPDRLPKEEQGRGRSALKRITDWIRTEIRKHAGPPEGASQTVLSELAVYLPDNTPEEPFDDGPDGGKGSGEPGFGEQVTLTLRPVRRPMPSPLPTSGDPDSNGAGDGNDTGVAGGAGTDVRGGGGGDGGRGEGEGQGGTGTRGGGSQPRRIPVSRVRILALPGQENCYRLSFVAGANGVARLALEEAGDSSAMPRDDVRAVGGQISLDCVPIVEGERTVVEITADGPIDGRAWRLSATEVRESQR